MNLFHQFQHDALLHRTRRHFLRDAKRLLERRAFRRVQDDLKLRFVVEGQHLHLHRSDTHQAHGAQQQHDDSGEK